MPISLKLKDGITLSIANYLCSKTYLKFLTMVVNGIEIFGLTPSLNLASSMAQTLTGLV